MTIQVTAGPEAGRGNYRDSVDALASAQKPSYGAPAYSVFVNRPAGRYLAAGAHQLGLTPNAVTLLSALCSYIAIACLALLRPTVGTGVVVGVLLMLGYALDSADGQLARLRGGGSRLGEWLDHMVDSIKISSLHLAVLITVFRYFGFRPGWLLVPIGYAVVSAVTFFGMILIDQLRAGVIAKATRPGDVSQRRALARSLAVLPNDYGFLCVVFLLLGFHHLFFGVYAALLVCNVGFLGLALRKWARQMKAVDELSSPSP
ncbi:CDP-alcohol phosphatidyltransferase family protein [uncultured Jatrophihabitans sp.]|uniref:CDP-alcohol phosphatidyltransferase family protein n=1 Tax=uncultured Jatrophihabitans sp. TaxID=1610747 RepID=UPI0035CA8DDD